MNKLITTIVSMSLLGVILVGCSSGPTAEEEKKMTEKAAPVAPKNVSGAGGAVESLDMDK